MGLIRYWKRSYSSDSDCVEFMIPLSTQIFDFHHHKHSYVSDSDFVTNENQPKVLKLLKSELESDQYSLDNSL